MTFLYRDTLTSGEGPVEVGFTDRRLDLGDQALPAVREAALAEVAAATGCTPYTMRQVHGADVLLVEEGSDETDQPADALVTARPRIALLSRAADCVPVLLADRRVLVGAVHAGRHGVRDGVVTAAVDRMRTLGATEVTAWIGPHICGQCYEVPASMRAEVAGAVSATEATTSWGTPALDLGAGVRSQLEAAGCVVIEMGACTREDPRLHSHRRDAGAAGRGAGVIWRPGPDEGRP
ncbi:MAG: polyphenol oxidase family protein [Nocardioides sp.]